MRNIQATILRSNSLLACLFAAMTLSTPVLAADAATQTEVLAQSTATLEQLVQKAHDGTITPEQLRKQRVHEERKLDEKLNNAPVAARAKEQAAAGKA